MHIDSWYTNEMSQLADLQNTCQQAHSLHACCVLTRATATDHTSYKRRLPSKKFQPPPILGRTSNKIETEQLMGSLSFPVDCSISDNKKRMYMYVYTCTATHKHTSLYPNPCPVIEDTHSGHFFCTALPCEKQGLGFRHKDGVVEMFQW